MEQLKKIPYNAIRRKLRANAALMDDVKTVRELGKGIPICQTVLEDLSKTKLASNMTASFYAGALCVLALILEKNIERTDSGKTGSGGSKTPQSGSGASQQD